MDNQLLEDPDSGARPLAMSVQFASPQRTRAAPDVGFDLTHHKRGGMRVSVEYRVDGFSPPAVAP